MAFCKCDRHCYSSNPKERSSLSIHKTVCNCASIVNRSYVSECDKDVGLLTIILEAITFITIT